MCLDGHHHPHVATAPTRLSRRQALKGAGMVVPAALAASQLAGGRAEAAIPGAWSMAMHLHASFSEGYGSMSSHLSQATLHGVDVVWWTDHDHMLANRRAKRTVHFSSLAEEGDGPPWTWVQTRTGSLGAASGGGIVRTPASPLDPVRGGSLRVLAQSTGAAKAAVGYAPSQEPDDRTWKSNLAGQLVSVEVLPRSLGPDAYLEIVVSSSWHPAVAGRSAGIYTLSYRLGGRDGAGTRRSVDRLGIITLPFTPGAWNSLSLRPDLDLKALFPEIDSRDCNMGQLRLAAVSSNAAPAEGYYDYLRFARPIAGEVALDLQRDLVTGYTTKYRRVAQRLGVEVSLFLPHVNWYGNNVSLPSYEDVTEDNYLDYVRQVLVPDIHTAGGVASYNHPFGVSVVPPLLASAQDQVLRQVASTLLPARACGADVMEVGYPSRGGMDLGHHLGLWDVMSRNEVFLTGNGVSDDHAGTDWRVGGKGNNWLTYVWAPDRTQGALLSALRAGRAWCASLASYRGALDLLVDRTSPMGSVSVAQLASRSLQVTATGLPTGATVQVVRGVVDGAGVADPVPRTRIVRTFRAADLVGGQATLRVDTATSCFVRTQVLDSAGTVIAASNPVWLLRRSPAGGIPGPRQG